MKMESLLSKFTCLHCLLLLLLNATHCFSYVQTQTQTLCHADEHSFLLQFKESFTIDKSASRSPFAYPKIASWAREGDQNQSNCCLWDGVECHAESGRVIGLDLKSSCLHGSINSNSTLFRLVHLQMLDLSDNNFNSSKIPSRLGHDLLQGKLPRSMADCTRLEFLQIGNNQISDTFPSWLGVLPVLRGLILGSNAFHGIIGKPPTNHEFPNLCIIDLSDNLFSGMLPSKYMENWNFMKNVVAKEGSRYFEVSSNDSTNKYGNFYQYSYEMIIPVKGVELRYVQTPYDLRLIDFSNNRFEGEIPASIIASLRALQLLNLSNNTLSGQIPSSLANLTALESLDLSQNKLSGMIPSSLAQLTFLGYFNVSYNHLWGPIPLGRQFGTFLEDSYQGNSGLCGELLSKKCEASESSRRPPRSSFEEDEEAGFPFEFDWYVVLPGVISGLIVGVVAGNTLADKKHEWFAETLSRRRKPTTARATRGRQT